MRVLIFCIFSLFTALCHAAEIVNVFFLGNTIPTQVIQQFERETGIKVNSNSYESHDTLVAKLKATTSGSYDVIQPPSYFIQTLKQAKLLEPLDKRLLSNIKHLEPELLNQAFDPNNKYSLPYIWGLTGIVINRKYYPETDINSWQDLWHHKFKNKLLLIDDPRDLFMVALISLGYSVTNPSPEQVDQAYQHLKALGPNIKLFGADIIPSLLADEDAKIGIVWNGDVVRAQRENPNLSFIIPKQGGLIWIDCLAIAKNSPNKINAHRFINFLLRPDIAKQIALVEGYTLANRSAHATLPSTLRDNPVYYPNKQQRQASKLQNSIPHQILALFSYYWALLKLSI